MTVNTDAQALLDSGVNHLKKTTVGYSGHSLAWQQNETTEWYQGLRDIQAARALLDPAPAPVPTPTPTPTPGDWTRLLGPNDDFNLLRTSAKPGERIGLAAGATYKISSDGWNNAGNSNSPIIVGSVDPSNPAKISGRFDMRGGFAWWNFHDVLFRDNSVPFETYQVSWILGGNHVKYYRCDFSNGNTKIGMEQINSSQWGVGSDNEINQCRFHDIGRKTSTKPDSTLYPSATVGLDGLWHTNNDHGLYDVGYRMHVIDTIFQSCADRGLQLRGAKNGVYEYITISKCGEGVIFGDIGAVGCTVSKSIFTERQISSRSLVEEYDPSGHDSGNKVDDFFVWNPDGKGALGSVHSVAITNMHQVNPQLDSKLMPASGSPAVGYGCRVALPVFA